MVSGARPLVSHAVVTHGLDHGTLDELIPSAVGRSIPLIEHILGASGPAAMARLDARRAGRPDGLEPLSV